MREVWDNSEMREVWDNRETREVWDNRDHDFWMLMEKYGELGMEKNISFL